eukprot:CAMPEP_0179231330 /NCGR_PEP_ID=MMETSP0797-20121207/11289_1 /TAXON_ID=47934 /ORGANISM="Dinophysis acuminata, Strain DAEP01" /LENGTH=63 /DNA_ID=CAMNT_0020938417 /DNA_START=30 /DNA_END=217 /DNA_ORIENTATION=-
MPTRVHVGNLDKDCPVEKEELEDLFKKYGDIVDCWVARQPAGFAFITFDNDGDAQDAVRELDG